MFCNRKHPFETLDVGVRLLHACGKLGTDGLTSQLLQVACVDVGKLIVQISAMIVAELLGEVLRPDAPGVEDPGGVPPTFLNDLTRSPFVTAAKAKLRGSAS